MDADTDDDADDDYIVDDDDVAAAADAGGGDDKLGFCPKGMMTHASEATLKPCLATFFMQRTVVKFRGEHTGHSLINKLLIFYMVHSERNREMHAQLRAFAAFH